MAGVPPLLEDQAAAHRSKLQLEDLEEVNRMLVRLLPGKTTDTRPPLTNATTLGSSAARPLPQLVASQVAGLPPWWRSPLERSRRGEGLESPGEAWRGLERPGDAW